MRGVNTLYLIPMFAGNEIIGTVGIDILDKERRLLPPQLRLAETIIFQAATAVQNARLFNQSEQRAADLSLINAVSELASSNLDLSGLFESVGQLLRETFAAESIYFALFDKEVERITFPYFLSREEGRHDVAPHRLADGSFTGQIIESKASLLLNWEPDVTPQEVQGQGGKVVGGGRQTDSYLGTPMIVGNEVVGVVALSSYREKRTYNEQDRRLLETLADTIGVAVQNIRQFREAQVRAQQEQMLRQITQRIRSSADVETIMRTAVQEIGRTLGRKTYIYLGDDSEA
jgi:GAF domain-containing protein